MDDILKDRQFDCIADNDRQFILAFNNDMTKLGYSFGDKIGSGYCWGKYMIIYTRSGVKSKKVFARIYIRDDSIVLRFFFSDIDRHRRYIENSPTHIKGVFVGDYANCKHCHNEKDASCQFRKTYTIDDRLMEKCSGNTFEFFDPSLQKMDDYMTLFTEFYPNRKRKG